MEFNILEFLELDSTNAYATQLARKNASPGTVVRARVQWGGRGRAGRTWSSPIGGLYASIILPLPSRVTDLGFIAGVAVAEGLGQHLPPEAVGLKWPNDSLLNHKKVGGILAEAATDTLAVVGIGINVHIGAGILAKITRQAFPATSIQVEFPELELKLETLLSSILERIHLTQALFLREGFPAVLRRWEKLCPHVGRTLSLDDAVLKNGASGKSLTGVMLGVADDGSLVLSDGEGGRHFIVSGTLTCCSPST